jgi:hypothetical protein
MGKGGFIPPAGTTQHEAWKADEKRHTAGSGYGGAGGGNGGRTCFVASTPVLTPEGWKPIASLDTHDAIVGFDEGQGRLAITRISHVRIYSPQWIWEVAVDGCQPVGTTKSHLILTANGWKRVDRLQVGDKVFTNDGISSVTFARQTDRFEVVYNLLATSTCTYVAGGLVVNSFGHLRLLRTWLHQRLHKGVPQATLDVEWQRAREVRACSGVGLNKSPKPANARAVTQVVPSRRNPLVPRLCTQQCADLFAQVLY